MVQDSTIPVTSSLYITMQNRLVCGRADGSIVLLNGIATLKLLLLQQAITGTVKIFYWLKLKHNNQAKFCIR